ncbi:MAG: hypothetical protein PUB35_07405 [Campylobacteraceae bacterium]|nr:hypothetical protein [Campylobacteraceae bacterium]
MILSSFTSSAKSSLVREASSPIKLAIYTVLEFSLLARNSRIYRRFLIFYRRFFATL